MRRVLMGLAVCVLALTLPGAVHAQRGGGGGHGGGGGRGTPGPAHSGPGPSYGHGGSGYRTPGYAPGNYNHNYYNRGYYGRPYGYADFYFGFSYYPYVSYLDAYPYTVPEMPAPYLRTPYVPSVEVPPFDLPSVPQPAPIGNVANIRVILPSVNAKLLVDGSATTSTGETRLLETPELKPGKSYHYDLTVTWEDGARTITEKRTVEVAAGAVTLVDFTRPAPRPQP